MAEVKISADYLGSQVLPVNELFRAEAVLEPLETITIVLANIENPRFVTVISDQGKIGARVFENQVELINGANLRQKVMVIAGE